MTNEPYDFLFYLRVKKTGELFGKPYHKMSNAKAAFNVWNGYSPGRYELVRFPVSKEGEVVS